MCIREYANRCTAQSVPFLEGIWVDPMHRRHRIGRPLLDAISDDLKEQGFHELCSDAEIKNRRSHKAHESWCFARRPGSSISESRWRRITTGTSVGVKRIEFKAN
ncbi:GNAT family N-acetyltransferase [Rhizobium sullae]|uniref:GNAT family N-acetyltransferase n=1 Tax=Rhizobium sullae TaxID=50338 RepID=UPI0009FBE58C